MQDGLVGGGALCGPEAFLGRPQSPLRARPPSDPASRKSRGADSGNPEAPAPPARRERFQPCLLPASAGDGGASFPPGSKFSASSRCWGTAALRTSPRPHGEEERQTDRAVRLGSPGV